LEEEELVVTSARLTPSLVAPAGTSVTFYVANEDPPNWQLASACADDPSKLCVSFPKPIGRSLRWKATMCANAARTLTPRISAMTVEYDYTVAEAHFRAGAVTQDDVTYVGAFKQPGDRGHLYALATDLD